MIHGGAGWVEMPGTGDRSSGVQFYSTILGKTMFVGVRRHHTAGLPDLPQQARGAGGRVLTVGWLLLRGRRNKAA